VKHRPSILLLLALLWAAPAAFAQAPYPLLTNVPGRTTQTLDGMWHYIIDPMENGYYSYRYVPTPEGYFKDKKPQNKQELVEYSFDNSEQMAIPGDWNTARKDLFFYEGTIWFKKAFTYHKTGSQRAFLYFGAVNYEAKVYLNGEKLGEHIGGFTPFDFEVTSKLKEGENFVVVKVDNTRRRDQIPTNNSDWWNFGGITRSVQLITTPETFIRDSFVQLKKGSTTELEGWVQLDGPAKNQPVTVEVPSAKWKATATPNADGRATISGKVKLQLWSPESPKLYDVTVRSGDDHLSDQIGFRTLEVRGPDILLNGKSVFLRGICTHEVAPYTSGRVTSVEQCRTLLGWAKELNCNFIRLAHYPHNEDMVREAERMGILVWSEIPVYWTIEWENPAVLANAQQQLTDMITRDKNRSAIAFWSIGNETPPSGPRTQFMATLAATARKLDNTRLITGALEVHTSTAGARLIDDPLGKELDVLGVNNYCGWYAGAPESCGDINWESVYNKPMIMSEFGGDAQQGRHGASDERWTEEYQDAVYTNNFKMLDKIPFLRGATPWILMDFHSARRPLPGIQDFYNRKGLISDRGVRKKAFYTLQAYYRRKQAMKPGTVPGGSARSSKRSAKL
jgi:beta-glucuronidase